MALLEAGGRPPAAESMPAAVAALQLEPETDWMYTADAGKAGRGLDDGRMMVPRGKMLGGSSGINYMAYVRGHPGDFDAWAAGGADGLELRRGAALLQEERGARPERRHRGRRRGAQHRRVRSGVSVRAPVLAGAREFVEAAVAAGIPGGDYNGRDRGGAEGVVSLLQTTTRDGKRSSTYHAFLEGEVEQRPNLDDHHRRAGDARAARGDAGGLQARGVEYRDADGETAVVIADKEVILSAGAIGSPHSCCCPASARRHELEAAGVACRSTRPMSASTSRITSGRLLLPGAGCRRLDAEIGSRWARRAARPAGPLPADPADDADLPDELQALKARSRAARHRVGDDRRRPRVLVAVRCVRVVLHRTRRPSHSRRANRVLLPRLQRRLWRGCLESTPTSTSTTRRSRLAPDAENVIVLANPVQPHSEGEIVLRAPTRPPIRTSA